MGKTFLLFLIVILEEYPEIVIKFDTLHHIGNIKQYWGKGEVFLS